MTAKPGDVLIILLNDLGLMVDALPALKAVRAHHRGANITMLSRPELARLAADSPYVDEAEPYGRGEDLASIATLGQQIRRGRFSVVYDLESSPFTERVFLACKPFPPPWCGAARGAKHRFVRGVAHPVDTLLAQVRMMGAEPVGDPTPDAAWARTAQAHAPRLTPSYFGLADPYIVLAPAAEGGAPRWPAARWAGLAVRMLNTGVGVAIAAEPQDRAVVRSVVAACPDAKDLGARGDLTQIAAVASGAQGALGHADVPMTRLIAASGAPTISITPSSGPAHDNAPRGRQVIALANDDPGAITVDYAAALFRMYTGVGAPAASTSSG